MMEAQYFILNLRSSFLESYFNSVKLWYKLVKQLELISVFLRNNNTWIKIKILNTNKLQTLRLGKVANHFDIANATMGDVSSGRY
jgi:predicted ferric reductase